MTSPSVVRPAVLSDEPEIWRLLRLMHEENALFPLSEHKVQFYLDRALRPHEISADDTGPRGIIGAIGPSGSLEAMIMLVLSAPWYSDVIGMDDCVSFVDPNHRRSDHAKVLIAYAKNMVDEIRKSHSDFTMTLGVVSTQRTAAKIRLYERQLTQVGAYFIYPPPAELLPIKNRAN